MRDKKHTKDKKSAKLPVWVFVLAGLLVVGVGVAVPVVARLTDGGTESYLADAETYMQAGDVRSALIQLRNAVKDDPDNAEARLALGTAYLEAGDPRAAEAEFDKAERLGIAPDRISVPMAEALLRQGRYDEVLSTVEPGDREPDLEARVLTARGFALTGLKRFDEAEEALIAALEVKPTPEILVGLAQVNAEQGDFDEAGDYADRALEIDPKVVAAIALKGDLARRSGDEETARALFAEAIELDPANIPARLARAAMLLADGEPEQAEGDVEAVLSRVPNHPLGNYLRGLSLARSGEDLQALTALQKVEAFIRAYPPGLYLMSVLHLRQGQLEQAETTLQRLLELEPDSVATKKLLGLTYLRKSQPERTIELLTPVVEAQPNDSEVLSILANAQLNSGNSAEATRLAEQLISDNPGNEALQTRLGTQIAVSELRSGRVDEALAKLEGILEVDPASEQANMLLVLTYLRQDRTEEAVAVVQTMKEQMPDNPLPHHLMGRIGIRGGEFAAARSEFEQALAKEPTFVPTLLNLALLDVADNDLETARQRFDSVLENDPDNVPAMMALSGLAFRENDSAAGVEWLQKAVAEQPSSLEPRLRLVNYYLQSGDDANAVAQAREASDLVDGPRKAQALELLGRAEMQAEQYTNAANTFRRIIGLLPNSVPAHRLLAQAQLSADNPTAARRTLEDAIIMAPENADPRVDLIRLEVDQGDFEAAMRVAVALRDELPDSAVGDTMVGDVLMEAQLPADAIDAYEKAIAKEPTSALAIRRFRAQAADGDKSAAMQGLRNWLETHPDDTVSRFALASELLNDGEHAAAQQQFETLLTTAPDNPVVLNNLAWLADKSGDPKAFEYAEQAHAQAPESPEIADTYAWLLLKRDEKVEEAADLLAGAFEKLPDNPEIKYHYAVALEKTGDAERAGELLRQIIEDGLDAAITSQAEERLAAMEQ